MNYTLYNSPLGKLFLVSEGKNLNGLWIEGAKYFPENFCNFIQNDNLKIFIETKCWLDEYFKGNNPNIKTLKLAPDGTDFRKRVWRVLLDIPYGETATYGDLAERLNTHPRAVGVAVSHNPIMIIIPCHRVIGKDGGLKGYSGGIDKKIKLLNLEKGIMK